MSGSPLQARSQLNVLAVILVVLGIFAVIAIIYLLARFITAYKNSEAYLEREKKKPTNFALVNEVAKTARLLKEERDILWKICKAHPTPNLSYLLRDPMSLEPLLKEEFTYLDQADADKQKSYLFSLRRKLLDVFAPTENMNSSRKIAPETELTYTASRGVHYKLLLLEKTPDAMVLSLPQVMIERGDLPKALDKIQLIFISKNMNAYQMDTRIIRYQTDKRGLQQMVVTHSESIVSLQRRQMERMDIEQPCLFSSVTVQTSGSGKAARVDYKPSETQHTGTLLDISGGGCRITTSMPIKPEQFIFIRGKLNTHDEDVVVGTIVRTTKRLDGLFILHIRFVKIELAVENRILALVCRYTQPDLEFLS